MSRLPMLAFSRRDAKVLKTESVGHAVGCGVHGEMLQDSHLHQQGQLRLPSVVIS